MERYALRRLGRLYLFEMDVDGRGWYVRVNGIRLRPHRQPWTKDRTFAWMYDLIDLYA